MEVATERARNESVTMKLVKHVMFLEPEFCDIKEEAWPLLSNNNELKKYYRKFFKRYDRDHNGTIDKDELGFLLKDLNSDFNITDIDRFMERIDSDHNNKIGMKEDHE